MCPIYLYRVSTHLSIWNRLGIKTKRVKNGCGTDGGNKTLSEKTEQVVVDYVLSIGDGDCGRLYERMK